VSDEELAAWLQSKGLGNDLAALKSQSDWNMDLRNMTDADVRFILSLPELRKLSIRGNDLTQLGIQTLIEAERLTDLDISCQKKPLRQLPQPRKAGSLETLTAERIGLDAYMFVVVGLPQLKHLNLGNSIASGQSCPLNSRENTIHNLRIQSVLKTLNLDNVDLKDQTLVALQNQQELESLNLANNAKISDDGVAVVAQLPALKALRLDYELGSWSSDSRFLTDASVESLTKAPQLEFLSLKNRLGMTKLHLTEKSISLLAQMTRLRYLDISHMNFRDDFPGTPRYYGETHPDVAGLGSLTQLEELHLAGSILTSDKLPDAGFLRNMPRLRKLTISGFEISPQTLPTIALLEELEDLNVAGSRLENLDLSPLYALPKLRHLNLGSAGYLTNKLLRDLIRNTKLESLIVNPQQDIINSDQPISLESTTLKKVKIYTFGNSSAPIPWIAGLAKLPQLEQLEIGDYYSRNSINQDHLNLLQNAVSLRELIITGDSAAQDWSALKNLNRLEKLQLAGKSEANIWTSLPVLPQLKTLDIPNDPSMKAYLDQFPKEQFIMVGSDSMTPMTETWPNIVWGR
jgi:hypothetical protein